MLSIKQSLYCHSSFIEIQENIKPNCQRKLIIINDSKNTKVLTGYKYDPYLVKYSLEVVTVSFYSQQL